MCSVPGQTGAGISVRAHRQHRHRVRRLAALLAAGLLVCMQVGAQDTAGAATDTGTITDTDSGTTTAAGADATAPFAGIEFTTGLLWQGQAVETYSPADNPLPYTANGIRTSPVLSLTGLSFALPLSRIVRFRPGFGVLFDEYLFHTQLQMAFPAQPETGRVMGQLATVLGLVVSLPFDFAFAVNDATDIGFSLGLSGYWRIPLFAIDGSDEITLIGSYLNGDGRWLYPETGLFLTHAMNDTFAFTVAARALLPLFHAWVTDAPTQLVTAPLPFWDQMLVIGHLGMRFSLVAPAPPGDR